MRGGTAVHEHGSSEISPIQGARTTTDRAIGERRMANEKGKSSLHASASQSHRSIADF